MSKSGKAGRNLKSLLVEPFRQIKFGLYMFGICTIFLLISGALFFHTFRAQYENVFGIFNVVDPSLQWEVILNEAFYSNAMLLIGLYLLFVIVLFTLVFKLTHRYYGPLVSIDRFVGELISGNYKTRLFLRKKDELQSLAKRLNHLAETLDKKHTKKE